MVGGAIEHPGKPAAGCGERGDQGCTAVQLVKQDVEALKADRAHDSDVHRQIFDKIDALKTGIMTAAIGALVTAIFTIIGFLFSLAR